MGYRDLIAALEWDEITYDEVSLVTNVGDAWYNQGGVYASANGHASPGWFQVGGAADGVFGWINGFVFGSHTARDERVSVTWSGIGAPGDRVRLRGTLNWSYYSFAVAPVIRIYAYLNGVLIKNLPASFTWEDGWPTTIEIDAVLDGTGSATCEFGIYNDNGIGSASINATFEVDGVYSICNPTTVSHRLLFPYPPEDVRSYRMPMPGSHRITLPSGESDAWTLGHHGRWSADVRWIPAVSALALPDNDGWEDRDDAGTTRGGWRRFLRHARQGGEFTFYPDKDDAGVSYPCVWAGSDFQKPESEDDRTRLVRVDFRTTTPGLIEGYSQ